MKKFIKKGLSLLIVCSMILTMSTVFSVFADDSTLVFDLDLSNYDGTSATFKATDGSGNDVSNVILSGRTGTVGTDEATEGQIKYFINDNSTENKAKAALQMATSGDTKLTLGSNVTIDMWINVPDYSQRSGEKPYMFTWGTTIDPDIVRVIHGTDKIWYFSFDQGVGGTKQESNKTDTGFNNNPTLPMPKNQWVKYTLVRTISGSNVVYKHYVNGERKTENPWSTSQNWIATDYIGFGGLLADYTGSENRNNLTKYADVKIYNTAKSTDEIAALYKAESSAYAEVLPPAEDGLLFDLDLTDYDGTAATLKAKDQNNNDVSEVFVSGKTAGDVGNDAGTVGNVKYFINNNTTYANGGRYQGAVQVKIGTGDDEVDVRDDVAIDMWMYLPSDQPAEGKYPIFFSWESSSSQKQVEAEYDVTQNYIEYNLDTNAGKKTSYVYLSSNPFPKDEWFKYTFVRTVEGDKLVYCYYINGERYELGSYDHSVALTNAPTIGFGGRPIDTGHDGRTNYTKFADVKIYSGVRTEADIVSEYNSEKSAYEPVITVPENGLVFDLDLSKFDGTNASLNAKSGNNTVVKRVIADTTLALSGEDKVGFLNPLPYFVLDNSSAATTKGGLQLDMSSTGLPVGNNVTIDMWLKLSSSQPGGSYAHIFEWAENDQRNVYLEYQKNEKNFNFALAGTEAKNVSEDSIPKDEWVKLTFVRSLSEGKLSYAYYVNGTKNELVTDATYTGDFTNKPVLAIGGSVDSRSSMSRANLTQYGDVKIYAKAQTDAEIAAAYNSEKATYTKDSSIPDNRLMFDLNLTNYDGTALSVLAVDGNGVDATNVVKDTSVGKAGLYKNSEFPIPYFQVSNANRTGGLQLNVGGDDGLKLGNNVTLDMWISVPADQIDWPRFLEWSETTDSDTTRTMYVEYGGNRDNDAGIYFKTDNVGTFVGGTHAELSRGDWNKLTLVREYNLGKVTYSYYINGVRKGSSASQDVEIVNDSILSLGGLVAPSSNVSRNNVVKYGDFKVYSTAKTEAEILAEYNLEKDNYPVRLQVDVKAEDKNGALLNNWDFQPEDGYVKLTATVTKNFGEDEKYYAMAGYYTGYYTGTSKLVEVVQSNEEGAFTTGKNTLTFEFSNISNCDFNDEIKLFIWKADENGTTMVPFDDITVFRYACQNRAAYTSEAFTGKTALFMGDSITNAAIDGNYSAAAKENANLRGWPGRIAEATGLTVDNQGVSGAGFVLTNTNGDKIYYQYVNQFSGEHRTGRDFYILHGGINDCGRTRTLGEVTPEGTTEFDTKTFAGAMEELVSLIISENPDAKFGYIINTQVNTESNEDYLDYVNKAKEVCEKYNVPYINLYEDERLTEMMRLDTYKCLYDGLHPSPLGYNIIYKYIMLWMETIPAHSTITDSYALETMPSNLMK